MSSLIEIKYVPYIPQLQVIIDGQQAPDFSRLIQYSDEEISQWAFDIMDTIYSEVRNDFFLTFTGTDLDAKIVRFACEKCKNCIGFKHIPFIITDSLPARMRKLNQLIKKANIVNYKKTILDAIFFVPQVLQNHLEDILSIDINNLFCAVRVSTIGMQEYQNNDNPSILFILAETFEDGTRYAQQLNKSFAFVLVIGQRSQILSVTQKAWYIETTTDELMDTIFNLFIELPLASIFRACIKSIHGGNKISKDLARIIGIEPSIMINIDNAVEVGKSLSISAVQDPNIGDFPKVIYKVQNSQVATCNGLAVYGVSEGNTVLEAYRSGSKKPFFTKEIKVYKRNRITKLILSDDALNLGVSDKTALSVSYFPLDADNTSQISWMSTDETILKVDSTGNITAISPGSCRIICTAENISAQCICEVKPYLSDLLFKFPINENGEILLQPMQELALDVERIPADCIDGSITITSSDSDVANVINCTLYARTSGRAMISIENSSGRISRSFSVVVTNTRQKKTGFFKKIFG